MTFRRSALAPVLVLAALPVGAAEPALQLVLTLEGDVARHVLNYRCDGQDAPIRVEYVNADPVFLALLPVAGEMRVFVNVISASGARYASGQYVWWTKGETASLYDEMAQEGTAPLSCAVEEAAR